MGFLATAGPRPGALDRGERAGEPHASASIARPSEMSRSSLPSGARPRPLRGRARVPEAERDHRPRGLEELRLFGAEERSIDPRHELAGLGEGASPDMVDGGGEPVERGRGGRDEASLGAGLRRWRGVIEGEARRPPHASLARRDVARVTAATSRRARAG